MSNSLLIWARKNLFNSGYNTAFTLLCLGAIVLLTLVLANWFREEAQWQVIQTNLALFLVGRYPKVSYWRVGLVGLWFGAIVLGSLVAFWQQGQPKAAQINQPPFLAFVTHPLSLASLLGISTLGILWLLGGGGGLRVVPTSLWNGLLLTLLLSVFSTFLAFPIGVLLALGRQSELPIVRWFSIAYIEIIRGLPLIGILFLAMVMLPLFLPPGMEVNRVVRAIAGLTLFNAAYLAENVRGGLQAIPRGQIEAARALGLNGWLITGLIVLPQALRAVIPAIVGQFISLFKDTSLLTLFALVELTGISRSILAQPEFIGRYAEVYLFIGGIYWLICFGMSLVSQQLEKQLGVGQR